MGKSRITGNLIFPPRFQWSSLILHEREKQDMEEGKEAEEEVDYLKTELDWEFLRMAVHWGKISGDPGRRESNWRKLMAAATLKVNETKARGNEACYRAGNLPGRCELRVEAFCNRYLQRLRRMKDGQMNRLRSTSSWRLNGLRVPFTQREYVRLITIFVENMNENLRKRILRLYVNLQV